MERLTHKARYEAGYKANKNMHDWECVDKLGQLEDLEEQGKLIKLPCAAGDTVYWVNNWFVGRASGLANNKWHITESKVKGFLRTAGGFYAQLENGEFPSVSQFGKTVFLTREEAEAALKEL